MTITRLLDLLFEPIANRRYVGRHRALGGTSFPVALAQPV